MKTADLFDRVDVDNLVKGDRVIAINDTGHLPDAFEEETFKRIDQTGAMRYAVLGKRSEESRLYIGSLAAPTNWKFYRKQARS